MPKRWSISGSILPSLVYNINFCLPQRLLSAIIQNPMKKIPQAFYWGNHGTGNFRVGLQINVIPAALQYKLLRKTEGKTHTFTNQYWSPSDQKPSYAQIERISTTTISINGVSEHKAVLLVLSSMCGTWGELLIIDGKGTWGCEKQQGSLRHQRQDDLRSTSSSCQHSRLNFEVAWTHR